MKNGSTKFLGVWRIREMDAWDSDYFDMEAPARIEFKPRNLGEFQFGLVQGSMDCEFARRDGKPAVEFSWDGNDETDPASGRGWAILENDRTLKGMIFIHLGERSGFTAVKTPPRRKSAFSS